jgi:hypothetical protein
MEWNGKSGRHDGFGTRHEAPRLDLSTGDGRGCMGEGWAGQSSRRGLAWQVAGGMGESARWATAGQGEPWRVDSARLVRSGKGKGREVGRSSKDKDG